MNCSDLSSQTYLSPSDTVRQLYKAMREKRCRDDVAMSIYKPALDGLTPQEFEDLRPDFEKMASAIPEKVTINGEQLSGDLATVFVQVPDHEKPEADQVSLMRLNGVWIIGDKENQAV